MVEPTIETYIIAGVFAFIGIIVVWTMYHYREMPAKKRPTLGTPGIGLGGGGGRMRLK
jgi:hypothetical protein